jgi:4-amino-4-deoxy-L-arabinose transferase-like glycosyltransferase
MTVAARRCSSRRAVNAPRVRLSRALLGGLVLAYLVTRGIRLAAFPPFFDEGYDAVQAYTAYLDPSQAFLALADAKGPLQSWLAMGVLTLHVNPLIAVRVVSLASGLVTLLAVVGTANRVAGPRSAAATGAVYLVLPFALAHDPLGLVDPITTACLAGAIYLQFRLAAEPGLRWGLPLGVVMGLGLLTKATSLFALVALLISLVLLDWRAVGRSARLRRWTFAAVSAVVIAFAIQSVMRLSDRYGQVGDVTAAQGNYHSVGDALAHLSQYVRQNGAFGDALVGYLTVPLILAAAAGIWWLVRNGRWPAAVMLTACFAGPVAIGWVLASVPYPRYILTSVPAFTVLAGIGASWVLAEVLARRGRVSPRLVVAAGVLALGGFAVARDIEMLTYPATSGYAGWDVKQYVKRWPSGTDYWRVADRLKAVAPDGKVVVATTALPPFNLAVLLGSPRIVLGSGAHPITSAVEVDDGRTTFRFAPGTDRQVRRARLGAFDTSLAQFVPAGVTDGQVIYEYTRPAAGTSYVLVRLPAGFHTGRG